MLQLDDLPFICGVPVKIDKQINKSTENEKYVTLLSINKCVLLSMDDKKIQYLTDPVPLWSFKQKH